jgi:Xaa-Pro aminopeptidase
LLLLDIGALVGGYAADITRTYAIGAPTKRMKDVHSAVKRAHEEIIHLLAPGVTIRSYHEAVDSIMKRELMELKLIDSLDDSRYRKYFPHAVSHGLGIDVHDSLGNTDQLKQGMILTVEPGIYIPEEGIGVRIEDDILITKDGFENLSATLSREL